MTSLEEIRTLAETFKKNTSSKTEMPAILEKILNLYNGYLNAPNTFFDCPTTELHFLECFSPELIKYLVSLTSTEVHFLLTL